jgi:uncharacterized small protein (DUF1192 family)
MAIDDDDLQPRTARPKPKDLEPLSIEALEGYIGELEAEIGRVRAAIEAKRRQRSAADAFFRKP